jgi:hypothetical protein
MGIAVVTTELTARDELEELFRLDASESEPEDDEDDEDDNEEDDDEDDDGDDEGEGVRPEGMPHD